MQHTTISLELKFLERLTQLKRFTQDLSNRTGKTEKNLWLT